MREATKDTTYEGWKNWETWNVVLWIDNEYPLYQQKVKFLNLIKRRNNHRGVTLKGVVRAIDVQNFVLRLFPQGTPDMENHPKITGRTLQQTPMGKVSFDEIAHHWQDELVYD